MIAIKNLRKEKPRDPWDIIVDRSTPLGNPFQIGHNYLDSETRPKTEKRIGRDDACDLYEHWFINALFDSKAADMLSELEDIYKRFGKLNLFCWCTPLRCHAETIKSYLEGRL